MGIRKIIYGILQLGAESTATTQATAVIQSTSGSLALVPSGSGAITAAIPDGTTTGGNARGQYAVDLQMSRTTADRVASSLYSTISGGNNNKATGNYVFIGGGNNNSAAGNDGYQTIVGGNGNSIAAAGASFIGGGSSNNISNFSGTGGCVITGGSTNIINGGIYNAIGGGLSNTVSTSYSTISGGQSNTASTNTHATVVGGSGNTASGAYSVAGGINSTASGGNSVAIGYVASASGNRSVVIGGEGCVATSTGAVVVGGELNRAQGPYSFAFGKDTLSYLYSQFAQASGFFDVRGTAQQSILVSRKQDTLTTGATSSLSLDGTGTTNLIIPSGANRTWNTTVNWVATVTGSSGTTTGVTVGNSIYGVSEFGFKVSASIASITPLIRDSIVADTAIMETATLTYATGSSNSLAMTFTAPTFAGSGSLGMRVVAKVSLVELGW